MNPEVKKIGNKLFDKVELSSVKVELGSIDIFIEAYKKEAAKLASIKSKIIAANDELGFLLGGLETLPKVGNDLITKMKELGIDSELQKVQSVNSSIDGLLKSLNPIYKNISTSATKI
jgi:hypothetical protein